MSDSADIEARHSDVSHVSPTLDSMGALQPLLLSSRSRHLHGPNDESLSAGDRRSSELSLSPSIASIMDSISEGMDLYLRENTPPQSPLLSPPLRGREESDNQYDQHDDDQYDQHNNQHDEHETHTDDYNSFDITNYPAGAAFSNTTVPLTTVPLTTVPLTAVTTTAVPLTDITTAVPLTDITTAVPLTDIATAVPLTDIATAVRHASVIDTAAPQDSNSIRRSSVAREILTRQLVLRYQRRRQQQIADDDIQQRAGDIEALLSRATSSSEDVSSGVLPSSTQGGDVNNNYGAPQSPPRARLVQPVSVPVAVSETQIGTEHPRVSPHMSPSLHVSSSSRVSSTSSASPGVSGVVSNNVTNSLVGVSSLIELMGVQVAAARQDMSKIQEESDHLRRLVDTYRVWYQSLLEQVETLTDQNSDLEHTLSTEGTKCKVCTVRKMDTIIFPCYHLGICSFCVTQIFIEEDSHNGGYAKCPFCRTRINGHMKINIVYSWNVVV
jgi:hypothetical protein